MTIDLGPLVLIKGLICICLHAKIPRYAAQTSLTSVSLHSLRYDRRSRVEKTVLGIWSRFPE